MAYITMDSSIRCNIAGLKLELRLAKKVEKRVRRLNFM